MAELRLPRYVGFGRWRCGAGAEEHPHTKIPECLILLSGYSFRLFLIAILQILYPCTRTFLQGGLREPNDQRNNQAEMQGNKDLSIQVALGLESLRFVPMLTSAFGPNAWGVKLSGGCSFTIVRSFNKGRRKKRTCGTCP